MKQLKTKSREASVLRQRRYQLVRRFGVPEELVGGSLSQCRRRCGKPNCHCAEGSGHAQWSLTFSRGGVRRVEKVPAHWVADLEKAVLETQEYLDALREVMAINVELLGLARRDERQRRVRGRHKSGGGGGRLFAGFCRDTEYGARL